MDAYRLDKVERLPNGALRVDALVTRTGVFVYHDEAGRPVREYRPPSEVNDAASVKSLRDSTVTVLHPSTLVTPENWDSVAVGHVSGEPVAKGDGVLASLVIQSKDAIDLIDGKKVQEISCGYQVELDDTPGTTPEGEKYDSVQRAIRYNHVAMGPPGWGRQGSSVSLRLDSRGDQVTHVSDERGDRTTMKLTIIYKGQTYVVDAGSTEHNALLQRIATEDAADKAKLDAATGLQAKLDSVTGERDALAQQLKETKTKLDAAPAAAVAQARARLDLETQARTVLGSEFKCDGLTDRDLRTAVIKRFDPESKVDAKTGDKFDRSEEYVTAVCDTYLKQGSSRLQEQMVVDSLGVTDPKSRKDGADYKLDENDPDPDAARDNMRKAHKDAARRPLSVSFQPSGK